MHATSIAYEQNNLIGQNINQIYGKYLNEISMRKDNDWLIAGFNVNCFFVYI